MAAKRYTAEQIVNKLREVEVLVSQGNSISHASKQIGVTELTYYRWRKEYGGLKSGQAKRLKELEKENARISILLGIVFFVMTYQLLQNSAYRGSCYPFFMGTR